MNPLRWASKIGDGSRLRARARRARTLAAEKYFFPGGAGEKIYLILFRLLREPEVCDAFFRLFGRWGRGSPFLFFFVVVGGKRRGKCGRG